MSTKNKFLLELYEFLDNHTNDFIQIVLKNKNEKPEMASYWTYDSRKIKLETTYEVIHYRFRRSLKKIDCDYIDVFIQRKIDVKAYPNVTIYYNPFRGFIKKHTTCEQFFYPKDFNDFYVMFHKVWFAMIESHKPLLEYVKGIDNQNEINEVHFETFENKIEDYISKFPGVEIVRYNMPEIDIEDLFEDDFKVKEKCKNVTIRIDNSEYEVEFFMGNDGEINRMKHYCFSDDLPEILSEMMKPWK